MKLFIKSLARSILFSTCALTLFGTAACHSYHVEATVENRTGEFLRLLEVDYPNASFGANTLDRNASLHYRFQIQGSGPLKVQYAIGNGLPQTIITGPDIHEHQEGSVQIILEPGGRAEFHPQLTPPN